MANLRKMYLYVNAENGKLVDDLGILLPSDQFPNFYLGEKVVLCIQIYAIGTTPMAIGASEFFDFSLDNNYDHTDPLMAYADSVFFNIPGDWEDVNLNEGRISIRLNCYNNSYANKVGTNALIQAIVEMKKFGSGSETLLLQNSCVANNVINYGSGQGPLPGQEYYNKQEAESLFTQINRLNLSSISNLTIDENNEIEKLNSIHNITPYVDIIGTLETISNAEDGDTLILNNVIRNSRITIKHGSGNIYTPSGQDYVLIGNNSIILNYQNGFWTIIEAASDKPRLLAPISEIDSYIYLVNNNECDGRPHSNFSATMQTAFHLPICQDGMYFFGIVESEEDFVIKPNEIDEIIGAGGIGFPLLSYSIGSTIQLRGTLRGWYTLNKEGFWTNVGHTGIIIEATTYNDSGFLIGNEISLPCYCLLDGESHDILFSLANYTSTSLKEMVFTSTYPDADSNASGIIVTTSLNDVETDTTYTYNEVSTRWEADNVITSDTLVRIAMNINMSSSTSI